MEVLFFAILVLCISAGNATCFMIGARIERRARAEPCEREEERQSTKAHGKKERVHKRSKETPAERAAREEDERTNVILENIDNYDGTSMGQKDVPM